MKKFMLLPLVLTAIIASDAYAASEIQRLENTVERLRGKLTTINEEHTQQKNQFVKRLGDAVDALEQACMNQGLYFDPIMNICAEQQCDADEIYDPLSNACIPAPLQCEVYEELDPMSNYCVVKTCSEDEILDYATGLCNAITSCPEGQVLDPNTNTCTSEPYQSYFESLVGFHAPEINILQVLPSVGLVSSNFTLDQGRYLVPQGGYDYTQDLQSCTTNCPNGSYTLTGVAYMSYSSYCILYSHSPDSIGPVGSILKNPLNSNQSYIDNAEECLAAAKDIFQSSEVVGVDFGASSGGIQYFIP